MGARGKVFWHATMSLDGFIADPEDRVDWVFEYKAPNPGADEAIRTTGAVLAGRRTYDMGISKGGKVYGGRWSGPQFVTAGPVAGQVGEDRGFGGGTDHQHAFSPRKRECLK